MELRMTPPALTLTSAGWERPLPAAWRIAQDSAVFAYALTLLRTTLAGQRPKRMRKGCCGWCGPGGSIG